MNACCVVSVVMDIAKRLESEKCRTCGQKLEYGTANLDLAAEMLEDVAAFGESSSED